jgi:hypothetical protein
LAILSEAASFLPFRTRVNVTYNFVRTALEEIARNRSRVRALTRRADERAMRLASERTREGSGLGVRFDFVSRGNEPILLEKRGSARRPGSMAPAELEPVTLPVFDRFRPTRTSRIPAGYLIPQNLGPVLELLPRHGIKLHRLRSQWLGTVDEFIISEQRIAGAAFQGRRTVRLEGSFGRATRTYESGDYLVRTAQPLSRLIFHLLEPESLDGVAAWGFLDRALSGGGQYPIGKVFDLSGLRTQAATAAPGLQLPKEQR